MSSIIDTLAVGKDCTTITLDGRPVFGTCSDLHKITCLATNGHGSDGALDVYVGLSHGKSGSIYRLSSRDLDSFSVSGHALLDLPVHDFIPVTLLSDKSHKSHMRDCLRPIHKPDAAYDLIAVGASDNHHLSDSKKWYYGVIAPDDCAGARLVNLSNSKSATLLSTADYYDMWRFKRYSLVGIHTRTSDVRPDVCRCDASRSLISVCVDYFVPGFPGREKGSFNLNNSLYKYGVDIPSTIDNLRTFRKKL